MSKSISEAILAKVKVRVTKTVRDDRKTLCGEPVQFDQDGNQFFVVPGHQADYVKNLFPRYAISDEFISTPPSTATVEVNDPIEAADAVNPNAVTCEVCGKTFKNNLGLAGHKKVHATPVED